MAIGLEARLERPRLEGPRPSAFLEGLKADAVRPVPPKLIKAIGAALDRPAVGLHPSREHVEELLRRGHTVTLVGGAVRDALFALKSQPDIEHAALVAQLSDIDLTTSASPEEIKKVGKAVAPELEKGGRFSGKRAWKAGHLGFGERKQGVDISTLQAGVGGLSERGQGQTLLDDLASRDFTANSLYVSFALGKDGKIDYGASRLIDPTGRGMRDALARHLHVADPDEAMRDPFRPFRYLKFRGRGYSTDLDTRKLIRRVAQEHWPRLEASEIERHVLRVLPDDARTPAGLDQHLGQLRQIAHQDGLGELFDRYVKVDRASLLESMADRHPPLPGAATGWLPVAGASRLAYELTHAAERAGRSFGELARQSVTTDLDTNLQQVEQLGHAPLPHDTTLRPARKRLLELRDMLDIFAPAYGGKREKQWAKLRSSLDTGYELLGHYKDLWESQGLRLEEGDPRGAEAAELPSIPADAIDYDKKQVRKLRTDLKQWVRGFVDPKNVEAARKLADDALPEPRDIKRSKLSRFFWGATSDMPKRKLDGIENLRRLAAELASKARDDYQGFKELSVPLDERSEKVFHDFRKQMRSIWNLITYYPEVYGDGEAAQQVDRELRELISRLGLVEDALVGWHLAKDAGKPGKEGRERVKDAWEQLGAWRETAHVGKLLRRIEEQLS